MPFKKILKYFTSASPSGKFGTFAGVFTPDVLTILGVIMFLRLGWVVGNAGFLGAVLIILLAKSITLCTGLSMSSITTNIKIGAGGAYSIITKSLGLEAGGSVGIPFFVAQTLSAALYIVGFTEGWLLLFPEHPPMVVSIGAWLGLMLLSYYSTAFALKSQFIILGIIVLSILSTLFAKTGPVETFPLIGKFEDADFWKVFAIFFPAVTGIMAGANLSGDLENPRKAIPQGTLAAIAVTMVIYIGLAYYFAYYIPKQELVTNQMVMIDYAIYSPLVIAGLLAATFSSGLGSLIGSPRILQALAEHKTVPFSKVFESKTASGEPRNAIIFTGLIVLAALILGNLDALATLITLFFLITYGMLNLVVFIQQSIKIISFRPTFKIPRIVSFYGAAGCIFMMMLIDPIFSVVALLIIIALYVWLTRKELAALQGGDIRGGMFLAIAEVASRISDKFPRQQVAWKPDFLIPIQDPHFWSGPLLFIKNITYPSGSIFAFTVADQDSANTKKELEDLMKPVRSASILVNSTVIEDSDFVHGARIVIQTLYGASLRPNTLFLTLSDKPTNDPMLQQLVHHAMRHELGTVILKQHTRMAFGMQKDITIWLRDKSPNWHLALLISLQLQRNWGGKMNLVTVADSEEDVPRLREFLETLSDQARLPSVTEFHVLQGSFQEALGKAPRSDVNIFGLTDPLPFEFMRLSPELTKSSCLFIMDSGKESALA